MKQVIKIIIPLENLLRDLPVNDANIKTLIGKPIIQGYSTIGIIESISEDGKYADGVIYLDANAELLHDVREGVDLYNSICFK